MRHLPISVAAVAALSSLAFAVAPAVQSSGPSLQAVPYMDTDPAGDGNAVNGQGLAEDVSVATGPAQVAEGDILGARANGVYTDVVAADGTVTKVLTGMQFRTALSAKPTATSAPLIHRFIGNAGGCTFWVQAYTGTSPASQAHGTSSVRLFDAGCDVTGGGALGANVTVSGPWATYSWDEDAKEMVVTLDLTTADSRIAGRFKIGEFYILESLHNRGNTGAATVPVFDEMVNGGFYTIGSELGS